MSKQSLILEDMRLETFKYIFEVEDKCNRVMKIKTKHKGNVRGKRVQYYDKYFRETFRPWYQEKQSPRELIVRINRTREPLSLELVT